jgi:RimJ/RimL family protein N-acetyltransferase
MYKTERLILREWIDADIEPFVELCADPDVMEHFPAPLTRDETVDMVGAIRQRFADNGFGLWAVECEGRFAGYVGLNLTGPAFTTSFAPCHEVGWRLAKWAWGRGYASEAAREALRLGFTTFNLDVIYSWTTRMNHRSEAVMKRIGMQRREDLDFVHPGTPGWHGAEHLVYSLSREQWQEYGK